MNSNNAGTKPIGPLVHELAARHAWAKNPALAFTYADFGDFLQSYSISHCDGYTTQIDDARATNYTMDRDAAHVANLRIMAARRPVDSDPLQAIADRRGHRLVLWIYGPFSTHSDLSPAVVQASVCRALEEHEDALAIILRIDSCGGSVRVAEFIANRLIDHRARKIAIIDRECMSAANFLTMACDRVVMRRNATMMIHRQLLDAFGNADLLAERAKDLRSSDELFLRRLANSRGISPESLRPIHRAAKYLTADEALALGLVDQIIAPLPLCSAATAAGTHEDSIHV